MYAVVLLALLATNAQLAKPADTAATVSGRVSIGGGPARNVVVVLIGGDRSDPQIVARTRTDAEGLWTLKGIAPGTYSASARAIGFVAVGTGREGGVEVDVGPNDRVTGVDLEIARGGVVTGRVTNVTGRPIVGERVVLTRLQANGSEGNVVVAGLPGMSTDDRGIYRIFGLEPGRYLVSVGRAVGERDPYGNESSDYDRTFHPSARERASAKVVELTSGGEAIDVDIAVGESAPRFAVSGRVVDAESGAPVAGASIEYRHRETHAHAWAARTGNDGTFRAEGLSPGPYAFQAHPPEIEQYCDYAVATVSNADVEGVTILVRRASAITGVLVVEGADDPAARASLPDFQILADTSSPTGGTVPNNSQSAVAPDGRFRVIGLRPGSVALRVFTGGASSSYSLLRVERDGQGAVDSIPVGPGETVSGVRLVLAYGTAVISGQVVVADGALPMKLELSAAAWMDASSQAAGHSGSATVDKQGRFRIEHLRPGTYRIAVSGYEDTTNGSAMWSGASDVDVRVTNGATAEVSITITRSRDELEREP
jgi:protocatechuate 3,4-dioxygenase beta subunit